MAITRSSLSSIPLSFASVSVGTPDDALEEKLKAISTAGFTAIELGFPDLLSFSSTFHDRKISEDDYPSLCTAGKEVQALCKKHNLSIMMLQPFSNFEGWAPGSKEREDAFKRAKGWIEIMHAVGTDMLQVGSSDSPNISTDLNVLSSDLRELADLLAPHGYRLAYENWCWATCAATWSKVWEIVSLVDRPNIGLCLDTFQTLGSEYADPTTSSGLIESAGLQAKLKANFQASLAELRNTVPKDKIFLLQISDAYKPKEKLENKEIGGLRPRGRWSHDYRPYPFNGGNYSEQCVEMARAVLGAGSRCWFSVEVFDGGNDGTDVQRKRVGMEEFCKGAMESVRRLLDACCDE
ncbi:xylose isomerase-like protein [Stipitochalara longipes BDJ]|nr:xylose isomerase-like protein [Stipitochalara longipes BDJ]